MSQQFNDSILIIQLDQAGAHRAKRLKIPADIILMFQPSHSPETNPYAFGGAKPYERVLAAFQVETEIEVAQEPR